MIRWTVAIERAPHRGAENMAIDASLLRAAGEGRGTLRLYRWSPPCLSFGRNEPAARRYDIEKIEACGIDTVRRPTGGRAVWHEAELTYAVVAPIDLFGSLKTTYISIHEMLTTALTSLGANVTLAPPPRSRRGVGTGSCFAAAVGGEIIAGGLKVVGSAQVRNQGAFLQHGSVLLGNRQEMMRELGGGDANAVSLAGLLDRPVAFLEIAECVVKAARHHWNGTWHDDEFLAAPDLLTRFNDSNWTWRR